MTPQSKKSLAVFGGIPALAVFLYGVEWAKDNRREEAHVTRAEWVADTAGRNERERAGERHHREDDVKIDRIDERLRVIYCATLPAANRAGCR